MKQGEVWGALQRYIQMVLPRKLDHGKVHLGDREKGNRVLKQWAGAVGIVAGAIWVHWRTSGSLGSLGPIVLWTGGLVLILFGLNRHLFRLPQAWLLSAGILLIHGSLIAILYEQLAEMNAWMIGAILIPEVLIMEIPFAWLEKRHSRD
jgi:hypothetical protein